MPTHSNQPLISVITATLNSASHILTLINDLAAQSDPNFEWVIADGDSSDTTLKIIKEHFPAVIISQQKDFGIYDALNRGVKIATGQYYLVIGSDDRIAPDAVAQYKAAAAASRACIITAPVKMAGEIVTAKPGKQLQYGIRAFVSSHSVGTLIRRSLHETVGYYSPRFPICADHFFFQRAVAAGANIHISGFIAGEFTLGGLSGTDAAGLLCENYRINLTAGRNKFMATLLLCLRLLKNLRRL